jgi:hypothetical protein
MAKIRSMGQNCLAEAEQGHARTRKNRDEAVQAIKFMRGYKLLSAYFEKKVAAATVGLIYSYSRSGQDRRQAETLADEALASYEEVANFLHQVRSGHTEFVPDASQGNARRIFGRSTDRSPALVEVERKERAQFAQLFFEGKGRFSDNFIG